MGWKLLLLKLLPNTDNSVDKILAKDKYNPTFSPFPHSVYNIRPTAGAHAKHPYTRHKGSPAFRRKGSLRRQNW